MGESMLTMPKGILYEESTFHLGLGDFIIYSGKYVCACYFYIVVIKSKIVVLVDKLRESYTAI